MFKKTFYLTLLLMLMFMAGLFPTIHAAATVQIKAGYLKYTGGTTEISQGVTIIKDDITVTSPQGEVNKEKTEAVLTEGVILQQEKGEVKSEEMTALLKEDKYIFKKKVRLNYRLDKGDSFQLDSPYLEMYVNDKSFQARQGVEIRYKGKLLKAEQADFNEQQQLLKLYNNVYIQEENGDWIRGEQAVFYLDEDKEKFSVDGNVEIEIKLEEN